MSRSITLDDLERNERRQNWNTKRTGGAIPTLSDDILDDPEWLRDWLTAALRPRDGWRIIDFEHGENLDMPCALIVANGQRTVRYRFRSQRDLTSSPSKMRATISTIAGGQLRPPQLKQTELGDLWQALCALQPALAAEDEPEQAKDWLFRLLDVAHPLEGHSLTDGAERRDALMALRKWGEFTYLDALTVRKNPDQPWPRRPVCLVDRATGEMWLRARESATFLRHILDVKIRQSVLTYRWNEIGVEYRYFESRQRRPGDPHPKAHLYLVPTAARRQEAAGQ
jgi:hypothetical protein